MFVNALRAPEIVVEGVAYTELVGGNLVRVALFSNEQGSRVLRVKLLMPVHVADAENRRMRAFLAKAYAGPAGAILM